jgi:hypothetical protein
MKHLLMIHLLFWAGLAHGDEKKNQFKVAGRTFEVPSSWKVEKPSSRMRKAQYKNGKAEIVVFYFGAGSGGSVEANVDRWIGQFKEPKDKLSAKVEKVDVKKSKITTVSAKGTYMSGSPFGQKVPMPNYAMRGAIIECEGGPIFIKMTGPIDKVLSSAKSFDRTVRSGL